MFSNAHAFPQAINMKVFQTMIPNSQVVVVPYDRDNPKTYVVPFAFVSDVANIILKSIVSKGTIRVILKLHFNLWLT